MQIVPQPKNPTLAMLLSFLIPGLGQIYNGQVAKGILFIVAQVINALLMAIFIGFITGIAVLIWAMYDAYKTAEAINQQFAVQYGAGAVTPGYGQVVMVAQSPNVQTETSLDRNPVAPSVVPSVAPSVVPTGMKKCPRCAEVVQGEAQVCRFCGHEFVPAATTAE